MNEELMEQLHNAVGEDLLNRILSGSATSSDLSVAVKFLKDNNVTVVKASDEKEESPVFRLVDELVNLENEELKKGLM